MLVLHITIVDFTLNSRKISTLKESVSECTVDVDIYTAITVALLHVRSPVHEPFATVTWTAKST